MNSRGREPTEREPHKKFSLSPWERAAAALAAGWVRAGCALTNFAQLNGRSIFPHPQTVSRSSSAPNAREYDNLIDLCKLDRYFLIIAGRAFAG